MIDTLDELLRDLSKRQRELWDHADACDDEGAHIGEGRYYRNKAAGIGEAISLVEYHAARHSSPEGT